MISSRPMPRQISPMRRSQSCSGVKPPQVLMAPVKRVGI